MNLAALYNFIHPILDVAVLAFLLYKVYELLAKTQAVALIKGAGFLALVYGVAVLFRLSTLQWLLNTLAPGFFIAVIIVFQPELRKIIIRLGQGEFFRPENKPRLGVLVRCLLRQKKSRKESAVCLLCFRAAQVCEALSKPALNLTPI
jgi:diadenylate cyclase